MTMASDVKTAKTSPSYFGLTENAGRENDGPSKLQGIKLQDMKMTDQK